MTESNRLFTRASAFWPCKLIARLPVPRQIQDLSKFKRIKVHYLHRLYTHIVKIIKILFYKLTYFRQIYINKYKK